MFKLGKLFACCALESGAYIYEFVLVKGIYAVDCIAFCNGKKLNFAFFYPFIVKMQDFNIVYFIRPTYSALANVNASSYGVVNDFNYIRKLELLAAECFLKQRIIFFHSLFV